SKDTNRHSCKVENGPPERWGVLTLFTDNKNGEWALENLYNFANEEHGKDSLTFFHPIESRFMVKHTT
ncbi:MAG: hypothetical protein JXB38_12335, partial [Anaerolineales bacterium]|nr:hypothetical protein [Anaerolineales bacterium]